MSGGYCESNIERNPIHKKFAEFEITNDVNIKENEMKIYFTLDRFFYRNENNEIVFDTGFYERTYDLTFLNDPLGFFRQYSMRLMSLHTFLIGEILPFTVKGIWKDFKISDTFATNLQNKEFLLFDLRENWEYLMNDIKILESKIKQKSFLQKSLIWYTFGKLSQTNLDKFMNFYRFFESSANEFYQNKDKELNFFINNELNMFDKNKIKRRFRLPDEEKVRSFLKSQCIEIQLIDKIINFRHKIAHGEDYALEFNKNLFDTNEEMENIISIIINRKIKSWNIKNFKNKSFIKKYDVLICESKRKIVLIDSDDFDCYRNGNEKRNIWNISISLGRQTNEENLQEKIFNMLNFSEITNEKFDKQICQDLVNNFDEVINY